MSARKSVQPADLERREMQLTTFVCVAIGVLALAAAVFMYPVVFHTTTPVDKSVRNAFFGFCGLCLLLAGYVWDQRVTIGRLRRQMAENRRLGEAEHVQASQELLKTLPKFSSFLDRLPMEFRRTVATEQKLSIIVVNVKVRAQSAAAGGEVSMLADAAKAVSRRLREQDSIYILAPACFGAVLPGLDEGAAKSISQRISEGLADAAGAANRFSYKIDVLNYPTHGSSAHELQEAVRTLIPADNSIRALAEEAMA